jgi:hypothetical protein
MRTSLYAPGLRVVAKRGSFPLDPVVVGRPGLIVAIHDYVPVRYGVTLDGESFIREFAEDELAPLEEQQAGGLRGATGPTVGPTPSGGSGGQH